MSSPRKKKQPDTVAGKVLRRAEVSKMARKLQNRLALAHFKTKKGWEDLALDLVESKVDEELRRKRPSSSGDLLSDSSSSSDFQYLRAFMSSSPLKAPHFSDAIASSSSSSGRRKRIHHTDLRHPSSSSSSRKRFCLSPDTGRSFDSGRTSWQDHHQLAQSSPIRPRKQSHFTTSTGPNISLFRGNSSQLQAGLQTSNYMTASDDEDDLLPAHSFKGTSMETHFSPPRTPPAGRGRSDAGINNRSKAMNGKSGQEGADLLLYLATSPSPANPTGRSRLHPPSTPPPRNLVLPSSMMTTPGGSLLMSGFGGPNTPSQAFDFADFVNITPSPAQNGWPKTPGTVKTPLTVARRRLTFENFMPSSGGQNLSSSVMGTGPKQNGLGMQVGGDLIS